MRDGKWLCYQPWVYNAYTGLHSPGRTSNNHLIQCEREDAYATACGRAIEYGNIAQSWSMRPPEAGKANKKFCAACLKTVGLTKTKNNRRDNQRLRVYRSEWAVAKTPTGRRIMLAKDVDEAQVYVALMMLSDFRQKVFLGIDDMPPVVRERKGNQNRGHANGREIALGANALDEYTIIHELAHTIHRRLRTTYRTWGDSKTLDHSGHGRIYVGILLALVDEFMGGAYGTLLRDSFRTYKVKWTEWSPEDMLTLAQYVVIANAV